MYRKFGNSLNFSYLKIFPKQPIQDPHSFFFVLIGYIPKSRDKKPVDVSFCTSAKIVSTVQIFLIDIEIYFLFKQIK